MVDANDYDVLVREGFIEVAGALRETRVLLNGNALDLSALNTTVKSDVVSAINEILAAAQGAAQSGGASINDAAVSTASVYSSSKTVALLAALKDEILGGAGPTIDTLKELADLLATSDIDDDAALAALTTAVGNRVRIDAPQALTVEQQAQARANIGVDFDDTDFAAVFLAALNS